jgi:hypothetical protein
MPKRKLDTELLAGPRKWYLGTPAFKVCNEETNLLTLKVQNSVYSVLAMKYVHMVEFIFPFREPRFNFYEDRKSKSYLELFRKRK